jgi:hypothetical protein
LLKRLYNDLHYQRTKHIIVNYWMVREALKKRIRRQTQKYGILSGLWDQIVQKCNSFTKNGGRELEFVAAFQGDCFDMIAP